MDTVTPPSPRRSSPSPNLTQSILIVATVLTVTVIVSVALNFLLRYLNRSCLRRANATPSPAMTPSINASPQSASSEIPSSVADCVVCLSKFHNNDLLRILPVCCHAFHAECIDKWLRSNLSCPLCRTAILSSDSDLITIS